MDKILKFLKKHKFLLIIILLTIPTFFRMLKPGLFTMQDYHAFRQYEFNECVKAGQIPCRWAPDAGLGYGTPLFNFYGQFAYAIGEGYILLGGQIIDSIKFLFILSLLGSSIAMYFLAKHLWKDNFSALVSSVLYLYAPYRAVNVWVRGALPEAFSFILFPLILLAIEKKSLMWFSVLLSLLIITHNLSLIMFLPILGIWIIYRKYWKAFAGVVASLLLSAFYVLPVIFESKYVGLSNITAGYFDYKAHFISLYQIFISRYWGYGGSTWGTGDELSLSVGTIQWVVPLLAIIYIFLKRKIKKSTTFLLLVGTGLFYAFLTHTRSIFFWDNVPGISFIQFPWRFLGMVTFSFALASGYFLGMFDNKKKLAITGITIAAALILNFSFFREDIWLNIKDADLFTGDEWTNQRTASIGDYWPDFGHEIPNKPSDGKYINYFPGWVGATPDENGLIPSQGTKFTDTPVRRIGNIITLFSIAGLIYLAIRARNGQRKSK